MWVVSYLRAFVPVTAWYSIPVATHGSLSLDSETILSLHVSFRQWCSDVIVCFGPVFLSLYLNIVDLSWLLPLLFDFIHCWHVSFYVLSKDSSSSFPVPCAVLKIILGSLASSSLYRVRRPSYCFGLKDILWPCLLCTCIAAKCGPAAKLVIWSLSCSAQHSFIRGYSLLGCLMWWCGSPNEMWADYSWLVRAV